jgi:hypothetical protein
MQLSSLYACTPGTRYRQVVRTLIVAEAGRHRVEALGRIRIADAVRRLLREMQVSPFCALLAQGLRLSSCDTTAAKFANKQFLFGFLYCAPHTHTHLTQVTILLLCSWRGASSYSGLKKKKKLGQVCYFLPAQIEGHHTQVHRSLSAGGPSHRRLMVGVYCIGRLPPYHAPVPSNAERCQ